MADDYSADINTTGQLFLTGRTSGNFEGQDDVDWFRFHAEAGQTLAFYNVAKFGGIDTFVYIFDANGQQMHDVDSRGPFNVTATGDYYVAAYSFGRVGEYTQFIKLLKDDYPNDNSRVGAVSVNGSAAGELEFDRDIDRFTVTLEAGSFYSIGTSNGGRSSGPFFSVLDANGRNQYVTDTYDSELRTVVFQPNKTGVYSVAVGDSTSNYYVGKYTVQVSLIAKDDITPGYAYATAGPLALGQTVTGRLDATGDFDAFKVELKAGVTYLFDTVFEDNTSIYNRSSILNSAGDNVRFLENPTGKILSTFSFTPQEDGTYYLMQSNSQYVKKGGNGYSTTLSAVADDHGATAATAGKLEFGTTTQGVLEKGGGDVDWYAMSLDAGTWYTFSLADQSKQDNRGNQASMLRVMDADGRPLTDYLSAFDNTPKSMQFKALTDGTHYLEVSARDIAGDYAITAVPVAVDDHGDDAAHARSIEIGLAIDGKLQLAVDKDVFRLSATAGNFYDVEVVSKSPVTGSAKPDAQLYISYDEDARPNMYPQKGNLHQPFTAEFSGDYFFTVSTPSGNAGAEYSIIVKPIGQDDYAATPHATPPFTTASMAPGARISGSIGISGDHDLIKIRLEAGHAYVFKLQGALSNNGTLDTGYIERPDIMVYDPDKSFVYGTSFAHQGEPTLSYIASETKDYYLEVSAAQGQTGTYIMSASRISTYGNVVAPGANGTSGNDFLSANRSGERLNGGPGLDTFHHMAALGSTKVTRDGGDMVSLQDVSLFWQKQTLIGIERLLFADGNGYALDIQGTGGQAYRLYQAAFDRTPDSEGIGFWIAAMDGGTSLKTVANDFIQSAEFTGLYGSAPSDREFVKLLYNNVLHRDPDADGYNFWVNGLANGATRAAILTDFSESAENVAAVATIIGNGFAYTPYG